MSAGGFVGSRARGSWIGFAGALALGLVATDSNGQQTFEAAATFTRAVVPAEGRQVGELAIPEFGRWSIGVESKVGVALEVVDRRAGRLAADGAAGIRDGRVDLFLDRGEVRIIAHGPTLGRGEARLSARPFRELAGSLPETLVENRPVASELGDLEQRSWWIDLPERRRVTLEAAGRHLSDLRLWQGGAWLVDAEPVIDEIEPLEGRPLRRVRLTADLPAGRYRLIAYGGPELAWTRPDRERPLHLRWGIPRRAIAGREALTLGPFGAETFLVPGRANFFRIELPEAAPATLELATWDAANPFATGGVSQEIVKETVPPVTEIRRAIGADATTRVTVRGRAGQRVVLQHFEALRRVPLSGQGSYWIGTVHAGHAEDAIDATGVLFAYPASDRSRVRVAAAQAIELSARRGWARRFNLLATATLFLEVEEPGTYELAARGAAAQFRLEPLLMSEPPGYEAPPLRPAPAAWELDRGFYLLTLVPTEGGILDASIKRRGALDPLLDWVGLGGEPPPTPVLGAVTLGVVELAGNTSYHLWTNDQPGIESGPVVRPLPLDLELALPISLAPGAALDLPARASGAAIAVARAEDGTRLELAVDDGAWGDALPVDAGAHRVRVRSNRTATTAATIGFEPVERPAPTVLTSPPPPALASLPEFPRLEPGVPRFLDLEREASATFLIEAREAGLYRIETRGLLATGAVLRTRAIARGAEAAENGSGRNAALGVYLGAGDYQLTVRARGASAGRVAVVLERAPVTDGGLLADGIPARAELAAGGAVAYRLATAESSYWTLRSLRLGGRHPVRLEDDEGWPVGAPLVTGDQRIELEPGSYRAVVVPAAAARTSTRAVTRFDRVVEERQRDGHGPHPLALDQEVRHLWTEPEAEAERQPDRWRFSLPAAARVVVTLTDEMEGELRPIGGAGESQRIPPGRTFTAELGAGEWELAAVCSRRNHLWTYRLTVATEELLAGSSRTLALPASLTVSVGDDGDIEVESFGDVDVRARLFDGEERIAAADDRPADWNFLLARRLAPGRYRLELAPVGAARATTTVTMRALATRIEEPWRTGAGERVVEVGSEMVRLPLEPPAAGGLLAVAGRGGSALGLRLERRPERGDDGSWVEVARDQGEGAVVAVAIGESESSSEWSLLVRSLDRRPARARLTLFAGAPPTLAESTLAKGVELAPLPGIEPPLYAAAVELARPGCFRPLEAPAGLISARRAGEALATVEGAWVASGKTLWLATAGGGRRIAARRAAVDREPLLVRLAPGERARCEVVAAAGPVALLASALAGDLVVLPVRALGVAPRPDRAGAAARHRGLALAEQPEAMEVVNASPLTLEARLTAVPLAGAARRRFEGSTLELELEPRSATPVALASDGLRLALALEKGTAAAIGALGSPQAVLWADEDSRALALVAEEDELLLANPGDRPARVRLEVRPALAGEQLTALARGAPFERRFERSGGFRLELLPGATGTLHVQGARSAILAGADGTLARGERFALPASGGTLRLEHDAGVVAAWIEGEGSRLADAGFGAPAGAAEPLQPPVAVELGGGRRAFDLELERPTLLVLRATGAAAVAIVPVGGDARVALHPERVAMLAALPAGRTRLELRGLGGEALAGRLEVVAAPVEAIGEGLGPETLLAPGGARGYAFQVTRAGTVGVGVRAGDGAVESELFDAAGRSLGRDVVLWRPLQVGDYMLAVIAPDEGSPVRIRPAVVGIDPPSTGPPPETVRELIALERGLPPAPLAVVGEEGAARLRAEADSESSSPRASYDEGESYDESEAGSEDECYEEECCTDECYEETGEELEGEGDES